MVLNHKKISVYLKAGERAATSYYRFYQFFYLLDAEVNYNLMIPDSKWKAFFPIARHSKWKQVYIFFFIYFRVLGNLLLDLVRKPDCIVVSRCIINKALPLSFKYLLKLQKNNGSKIIWDFDDNIIGAEITKSNFDWFSDIANVIVVGSPLLKDMIRKKDREKTIILPTTDGDMHYLLTNDIMEERINSFEKFLKVIWVGTFSTLKYVEEITEAFEIAGNILAEQGKKLQLTIVCDKELKYKPNTFELINIKWDKQTAINQLLYSHVGIMPLENNEITRGKCGFKLIQYLSVGLPVIGSTVGMNSLIIRDNVGIGVNELNIDLWTDSILKNAESIERWCKYSRNAYKEWEKLYSYDTNMLKWKDILKS